MNLHLRFLKGSSTLWIASSSLSLFLVGCGGLERKSYPATEHQILAVGEVTHIQPYKGDASESGLSRAGWGLIAGGVIAGAAAGLADDDIGSYDAYSYMVRSESGEPILVNSFSKVRQGDCVAVYESTSKNMSSLSVLDDHRCQ